MSEEEERVCRACGESKNISNFGTNSSYKDNISPKCKHCVNNNVKMREDLKTTLKKRCFIKKAFLECTKCSTEKHKSKFYKDSSKSLGYDYQCKKCNKSIRDEERKNELEKEINKKIPLLEGEVWKDIPDYEGYYEVSSMGRVMSVPRIVKHKTGGESLIKKKILSNNPVCFDYVTVILRKNGKGRSYRVHRLVMLAFEGYSNLPVDHINEIRDDNRLENLRYCTPRENTHYSSLNKDSISEYIGVSYISQGSRWVSTIYINKKSYTVGLFNTEIEAHEAYQRALKDWENRGKTPSYKVRIPTSKCKGVGYHKRNKQWEAKIRINKKYYNLGSYDFEEEACEARKIAEENYYSKGILPHYVNPKLTSKYKYVKKHKNKWQADSPKINGKVKYLGVYESEIEAAKAVKEFLGIDKLLER